MPCQESELLEIVPQRRPGSQPNADSQPGTVKLRRNDFRSSTKLDALVQHLRTTPPLDLHEDC